MILTASVRPTQRQLDNVDIDYVESESCPIDQTACMITIAGETANLTFEDAQALAALLSKATPVDGKPARLRLFQAERQLRVVRPEGVA